MFRASTADRCADLFGASAGLSHAADLQVGDPVAEAEIACQGITCRFRCVLCGLDIHLHGLAAPLSSCTPFRSGLFAWLEHDVAPGCRLPI